MKSWQKPTPEDVQKVVLGLTRPEMANHFLGKLDNPHWIAPLREHGLFKHPPPAIKEGNSISFPVWPAVRYLVRAAAEGETPAAEAITAILDADSTDNHLVHLSYLEVAIVAPVSVAIPLVRSERKWIEGEPWLFSLVPEKGAELIARLAANDHADEAFRLARALLAIFPEQQRDRSSREIRARFDAWHYREALKLSVTPMMSADPLRTVNLLSDLLFEAAKLKSGPQRGDFDGSIGWRPAIEQSDQNLDVGNLSDILVDATRDAFDVAIRTERISIDAAKEALLKRGAQSIFQRLLLHVARQFRDSAPGLVREQLTQVSQMHSLDLLHEYSLLMRDGYPLLDPEQRKTVLSAIAAGPSSKNWDLSKSDERSRFDEISRTWKRDRLHMIKDHLDSSWRQIYEGLVESLGAPEHPDFFSHRTGVFVGPVSPKSVDELANMDADALVEYLVVWRPIRPYMAPSPEGLGRALREMTAKNPGRLLALSEKLHRLHPTYVRSVVAGIADAVKAGREVDSERALDLAVWATRQRGVPYELTGEFTDRDWTNTRAAIVDMVTTMMATATGLVRRKSELPLSYRTRVWDILSVVTEDEDPTADRERPDADEIEPSMIALNSVRGAAMDAVVQYALWIRRWEEAQANKQDLISAGFSALPEVRDVLDRHLEPSRDPSVGVRSVYGRWFPWLVMLDPSWAASAVDRIFPLAPTDALLFDAAWYTYVSFSGALRDPARLLTRQYQTAASRIGEKSRIRVRSLRSPAVALGEHLLVLYGRGEIALVGSALETFFARADTETRQGALVFVGRSLMRPRREEGETDTPADGRVPTDVIDRFQALWESRAASPSYSEEAPAFGWWFASGRFDDRWVLAHLARAAKGTRAIDGLMFGTDRLIQLAHSMPVETAEFLHALAFHHERASWFFEFEKAMRPVLTSILGSGARAEALGREIVDRLGETEVADYGDLLRKR